MNFSKYFVLFQPEVAGRNHVVAQLVRTDQNGTGTGGPTLKLVLGEEASRDSRGVCVL